MKRFTTDNPKGNFSTSMNLFYVKDGWTWIRGAGPAPDYPDISLCDFIRQLVHSHKIDGIDPKLSDEELGYALTEALLDGPEEMTGLVALLYTAGWAFAELRGRLSDYEDSGLSPRTVAALRAQQEAEKNEPLTIEELKAMPLKEWVWIEILDPETFDYLAFIKAESAYYRKHDYGIHETLFCGYPGISFAFDYVDYGKAWVAYTSRPPKEENK